MAKQDAPGEDDRQTPQKAAVEPGPHRSANSATDIAHLFLLEDVFPDPFTLLASAHVPSADDKDVDVAFDTNALLVPYQAGRSLAALSKLFKRLDDEKRLFAPARAIREFIRLRDQKIGDLIHTLNSVKTVKLHPLFADMPEAEDLQAALVTLDEAKVTYEKALKTLLSAVHGWRGDDPVTTLYRQVFSVENIVDLEFDKGALAKEWRYRRHHQVPPGYKDGGKEDEGIGDFMIWKSLLQIGDRKKRDMIFVTGETKPDWFVKSGGRALYPRVELLDEYRRASGGRAIRFSTLTQLAEELGETDAVVADIRAAEDASTPAEPLGRFDPATFQAWLDKYQNYPEYSTSVVRTFLATGVANVPIPGEDGNWFSLMFHERPFSQLMVSAHLGSKLLGVEKERFPGAELSLSGGEETAVLVVGDVLKVGQYFTGHILTMRLLNVKDGQARLTYAIYRPGETVRAP